MSLHACTTEVNDAIVALRRVIDTVTIHQISPLQQLSEANGIPIIPAPTTASPQQPPVPHNSYGTSSLPTSVSSPTSASTTAQLTADVAGIPTPSTTTTTTTLGALLHSMAGGSKEMVAGDGSSSILKSTTASPALAEQPPPQSTNINNNATVNVNIHHQQQYSSSSESHKENHRLLTSALDDLVAALEDQTMLMFKHLHHGEEHLTVSNDKRRGAGRSRRSSRRHRHRHSSSKVRRGKSQEDSNLNEDGLPRPPREIIKKKVNILGRALDEVDIDAETGEEIRTTYPTNGRYSSSSSVSTGSSFSSSDYDDYSSSVSSESGVMQQQRRRRSSSSAAIVTGTKPVVTNRNTSELTTLDDVLFTNPVYDSASAIQRGGLEGRSALDGEKTRARHALDALVKHDVEFDPSASKKAASDCQKSRVMERRRQRALDRNALESVKEEDRRNNGTSGSRHSKYKSNSYGRSGTSRTGPEVEDVVPTAAAQRRAEAVQLRTLRIKMEGVKKLGIDQPSTGTYAGPAHVHPTDKAALEALSVNFSCALQSCAHFLQASRARLYIPHQRTHTMKLVAACPDSSIVVLRGGQYIARNQGLPGAAASTGIAISIDNVTEDIRRNYLSSTYHGDTVESILVMPIYSPNRTKTNSSGTSGGSSTGVGGQPEVVGVMEFINKSSGQKWTEFDENMAYHTATLLSHFITTFGYNLLDLHDMPAFQLSQVFHSVVPYAPAPTHTDLNTLNPPQDSEIMAAAMKAALEEQQDGVVLGGGGRRDTSSMMAGGGLLKRGATGGSASSLSIKPTAAGRHLSFDPSVGQPHQHGGTATIDARQGRKSTVGGGSSTMNGGGGYSPQTSTPLQRNLRAMFFRPQGEVASMFRKPVLIARVTELADVPSAAPSSVFANGGNGGDHNNNSTSQQHNHPPPVVIGSGGGTNSILSDAAKSLAMDAPPQGVFETLDEEEVYRKRVRAARKHASRIGEIGSIRYVREISAYLASLEDTSRSTMDDLVTTRTNVNSKIDEIVELSTRVKVLENNNQYLNERLLAAQRQHLERSHSFKPKGQLVTLPPTGELHGTNNNNFEPPPPPQALSSSSSPGNAAKVTSGIISSPSPSGKKPHTNSKTTTSPSSTSAAASMPTDSVTLRAFLHQASQAADELKREALHLPSLFKNSSGSSNKDKASSSPQGGGGGLYTTEPYFTPSEQRSVFETQRKGAAGGGVTTIQYNRKKVAGGVGVGARSSPPRSKSSMM